MKNALFIFCFSLIVLNACKSKQVLSETLENKTLNTEEMKVSADKSFQIANLSEIDKQDLLFSIKKVAILDQKLKVTVQYGGGCIEEHQFELVTDGIVTKEGVMQFYLLHKTHNDYCKALIMKDLSFDLAAIYQLKSEVLTEVALNEKFKIALK